MIVILIDGEQSFSIFYHSLLALSMKINFIRTCTAHLDVEEAGSTFKMKRIYIYIYIYFLTNFCNKEKEFFFTCMVKFLLMKIDINNF